MDLRLVLLFLAVCLGPAVMQGFPRQTSTSKPFQVQVHKNGGYDISAGGVTWLSNGPTFFNQGGKRYCTWEGSLKQLRRKVDQGEDAFGQWNRTTFVYDAGNATMNVSVKVYTDHDLNVAVFSQTYDSNTTKTKGSDRDDIISSFPSFRFAQNSRDDLGFLGYGNDMVGWVSLSMGTWDKDSNFSTGIQGGPLVLFDKGSNAMVISPLSKFMAASNKKFKDKHISWGIMGLVDSVPAGYTVDFIVSFSDMGVNQAMRNWGSYLTRTYGKTTKPRDSDLTLTHLGYWTDNGAYYYYNTEEGKNYEDTMVDAIEYLRDEQLPIKYLQIDSWFYKKGHKSGTMRWVAEESVFPHGFKGLYNKTGLPIGCHNRYWDSETPYAKYNGGKYNFIPDKKSGCAVPDDQQFWIDLFASTQNWGKFILYEQDWLNAEQDRNVALASDLDLGRRWLMQMGRAAEKFGISIQYCMSYSRHILQSVEIPAVTQARVSDDYQPGNFQYKLGITAMFADALNLGPSKDTFWSTTKQPGNPYKGLEEPRIELQTRITTLSGGPVGPGDGIGYADRVLLKRCCDSDGKILRGSRPLTIMDKALQQAAFEGRSPAGRGEVLYSTVSNINGHIFGIIIADKVDGTYHLVPSDLSPGFSDKARNPPSTYIYDERSVIFEEWSTLKPLPVNETRCGDVTCVFHSAPVFTTQSGVRMGLRGEIDKFVPVSPERFSQLYFSDTGLIEVDITLNQGETVKIWFFIFKDGKPVFDYVFCKNPSTGATKARASFTFGGVKECSYL